MQYARAVIAAVLTTGLVIIVIIKESLSRDFWVAIGADPELLASLDVEDTVAIDSTFLLMGIAIIILTVPDALGYWRRNRDKDSRPVSQEDDDQVDPGR